VVLEGLRVGRVPRIDFLGLLSDIRMAGNILGSMLVASSRQACLDASWVAGVDGQSCTEYSVASSVRV
jgi:hypothetical protein